jgi:hypothetical protein
MTVVIVLPTYVILRMCTLSVCVCMCGQCMLLRVATLLPENAAVICLVKSCVAPMLSPHRLHKAVNTAAMQPAKGRHSNRGKTHVC